MELDPQVSPELGDHEQGGGAGLRKLNFFRSVQVVPRQQRSATDIVFVTLPSIVLAAVHGLSGLFRAVSAVEPSLSAPSPLHSIRSKLCHTWRTPCPLFGVKPKSH